MDETLRILNIIAADATLVAFTMIVGLGYLVLTYPALWLWTALTALVVYGIRKNKRLRRLWLWHIWYPIQRGIHKLTVPARRKVVGFLMCKIKKSVLADKLDDFLRNLQDEGHIDGHDRLLLTVKIADALEITDLIPRGKRWKAVTDRIVRKNCAETKAAVPSGLKIPGAPEPAQPGHQELHYLRKRNAA